MEKELQNILNELKDSIKCPSIKEIDYLTEECYETPNFFVLDPTTNECELLNDYITDLQSQLKRQQEINQKAIEYIKTTTTKNDELNCTKLLADTQVEQLLKILEDKEK